MTVDSELRKIWRKDLETLRSAVALIAKDELDLSLRVAQLDRTQRESWSRISELLLRVELLLDSDEKLRKAALEREPATPPDPDA